MFGTRRELAQVMARLFGSVYTDRRCHVHAATGTSKIQTRWRNGCDSGLAIAAWFEIVVSHGEVIADEPSAVPTRVANELGG